MKNRNLKAESGVTLLEIMIAMTVFIGGGVAFLSGIATTASVRIDCVDRFAAMETVLGIAEEISATPIDTVVGVWREGGSQGNTFSIWGLDDDTVLAGSIRVITDETLTDQEIGMSFGMPRDLDGDGEATSTDVSTTALTLPVVVEASWGPASRRETFRIPVVLLR
jgi:hypothetical protein